MPLKFLHKEKIRKKMENLKNLIKGNILFKDLGNEYIDFLTQNASLIEYSSEQFLFFARDQADYFYLILEGKVAVQMFSHEKGEIIIEEIKSGELLGWSWLKKPYKWKFDAITLKKTKLIAFDAEVIRNKMESNNEFGYKIQSIFMSLVIERLYATRLRLLKELGDNIYIPD